METTKNNPALVSASSRYYAVGTRSIKIEGDKEIVYFRRRFLPLAGSLPSVGSAVVGQGERPDLMATKTLGDPTQYWRICDANDGMEPVALFDKPGLTLRIPQSGYRPASL